MPKGRFFKTSISASSKTAPKARSVIPISKEARATLKLQRREALEKYQEALRAAHATTEQQIQAIASEHAKTVQHVRSDLHMAPQVSLKAHSKQSRWNAYLWKISQDKENYGHTDTTGKQVLLELSQKAKERYAAMTDEELDAIVVEYEQAKATVAKGFHSSARSRVNDVTKTLIVLGTEIENLRCRSGIDAILCITRSSTDTPLTPICYATEGVEKFIESVFKIDNHEFLARMEAFSIQGLEGTADNYKDTLSKRRGDVRDEILKQLRAITGDKHARMEWKNYWIKVVARYEVKIEGWPATVPFQNLSLGSSSLANIVNLLQRWQAGTTYWKRLTSTGTNELLDGMKARGEIQAPVPRRTRSDRGKKRKRQASPSGTDENGKGPQPRSRRRRRATVISPENSDAEFELGEDEE